MISIGDTDGGGGGIRADVETTLALDHATVSGNSTVSGNRTVGVAARSGGVSAGDVTLTNSTASRT